MSNPQKAPLKLFIKDIFRAQNTEGKYIYQIFGIVFKNVMINGVITAVYNSNKKSTNLEVSDITGTIQVYYNFENSCKLSHDDYRHLVREFSSASKRSDPNLNVMSLLLNRIENAEIDRVNFKVGGYVNIIGDIFVDEIKGSRMISAYDIKHSCVDRDLFWMEDLSYIYEKYYYCEKS